MSDPAIAPSGRPRARRDAPAKKRAPTASLRKLDALAWAHQTPRCRALGFDFAVRTMDRALGEYLDRVLRPFAVPGKPARLYSFLDRGPRSRKRYAVYFHRRQIVGTPKADLALSILLWHINRRTVEESPEHVLVHASAAEHDGTALLFPAPMESGKTTLVAGLLRAGLRYVTDEAVALDPAALRVHPFPKSLSVDKGSWTALADLRPTVPEAVEPYLGAQWHVDPDSIRPGIVAPPCEPGFVIAPRYVRGGETALRRMTRSEALLTLAENCFNLDTHGRRGFEALAEVVRRCECYRIEIGDLDEACKLILDLVTTTRRGASADREERAEDRNSRPEDPSRKPEDSDRMKEPV